jgi:hypothetical protein
MRTSEESPVRRPEMRTGRTRARLVAVAGAVSAALAVWVVVEVIAGVDLRAPAPGGGGTHDVGPLTVVVPSLVAASAGWALLAGLERFTRRARAIWAPVAIVVLVLSLGGPLPATGISTANQVALAAMHVAVAVTLIPLLMRSGERA